MAELVRLDGSHPVADTEVEALRRTGHVLLRNVFSLEEIDAYRPVLRDYVTHWRETTAGDPLVCTLADVPESVTKFVTAPRLGEVAARLLEVDAVRVLHFNGFFKPAFGVPTPLHQDMDYIPLDTDKALTIWVPLMDVTPEMGGLVFAEGSHLHGKLNPAQDARRFRVVKNEPMRVGDVSVHMGWTLHGALKNTTGVVREALAVFAYADGVRIDVPGKRPFDDIFLTHIFSGLGAGDIAAGRATPVVFRRSSAPAQS